MRLDGLELDELLEAGVIDPGTAEVIREYAEGRRTGASRFDFTRIGYAEAAFLLGGLVVLTALGWFMNEGWALFGGAGLLALASAYAILFLAAAGRLWDRPGYRVPAGLLYTLAVCMAPLAAYGLQDALGWLPPSPEEVEAAAERLALSRRWRISYVGIEAATVAAGVGVYLRRRFAFLVVPMAVALWAWWQHAFDLMAGEPLRGDPAHWLHVTFGLVVLVGARRVTRGGEEKSGFWLYLVGGLAVWIGMTLMTKQTELGWVLYLAASLALMVASILVRQRSLIVFGAMGVAGYLGHLAWDIFADSILFPVILMAVGVGIIAGAIQYHRHEAAIEAAVRRWVPLSANDRDQRPV